ncbi:AAA family ATPase [Hydrogenimonas sp.]
MKLSGKIAKILYFDEGFLIATLEGGSKIAGSIAYDDPEALVGQEVTVEGEWREHPRFGPQFAFESLEIVGSELYFYLTKVVKGVGKKLVRRLIDHYGEEELLRILDEEPQKLLTFKGIKEKKLAQITQSWERYRTMRQLAMFLAPYRIGQSLVAEIYRTFADREDIVEAIRQNPYIVTRIKGIGFRRADEMALSMGIAPDSPFRAEAAVAYVLKERAEQSGDSALGRERLTELVAEALGFEKETPEYPERLAWIEERIDAMAAEGKVVPCGDLVAHPQYYRVEKALFERFARMRADRLPPIVDDLVAFFEEAQKRIGFTLGEEQKAAVRLLNDGVRALALVGYAGTGKSTSAKMLLELLERRYGFDSIITTALSGIAAQRIHDTTGYRSATIQSLLVAHKEELPYDVVLLDEASMVNSPIFFQLLSRLKEDAVFIVVGDDGQLPPIGAGDVLGDIVRYELLPVVKLTKIYRQSEETAIALIADAIRRARVPDYEKGYRDFRFVDISIPDFFAKRQSLGESEKRTLRDEHNRKILTRLEEEARPYILAARPLLEVKKIREYLGAYQVITPMKGGVLGAEHLNRRLQLLCNPNPKQKVEKGGYLYGLYDKVVHIRNETMPTWHPGDFKADLEPTDGRIYNGMIGLLFRIDEEEESCYVYYPNEEVVVRYGFEHLGEFLTLAYALTIHKTQGMEYDTVLIPMTYSHYVMHNTKLLYTAVTRAKKMCIVVGEEAAFRGACRRIDTTRRTTVLGWLAQKERETKATGMD